MIKEKNIEYLYNKWWYNTTRILLAEQGKCDESTMKKVDNIFNDVIKRYSEPHRYWHGVDHICHLLYRASVDGIFYDTGEWQELCLAIFFHDIIYVPFNLDNERRSADLFEENFKDILPQPMINRIKAMIMFTSEICDYKSDDTYRDTLNIKTYKLSKILSKLDTLILRSNNLSELIHWEDCIFKEYQSVSYPIYVDGRVGFLDRAYKITKNEMLLQLKDYVCNRKPKIGLYVGSFNPFHVGHNNILEQAEKIFDKVIIGVGINPDKNTNSSTFRNPLLKYREVIEYKTLVTEFIDELSEIYDVTLIRGIRNASDLEYEQNYITTLKDLTPDLKYVMIMSDVKFHHVSSSMIRGLKGFTDKWKQYVEWNDDER